MPVVTAAPEAGRDRLELERVWSIADAALRAARSGTMAELAWATMRAVAWVSGYDGETPVTETRLRCPSATEIEAELAACEERHRLATSRREHARWTGIRDGLRLALGEPGPFWWTATRR